MANLPVQRSNGGQAITQGLRAWDPLHPLRELVRWDPFVDLSRVSPNEAGDFSPAFEVKETPNAFIFKADVPGVKESDLEVVLEGNRLAISGKREAEKQEKGEKFYSYERTFGRFTRSFTLPEGIHADGCTAELKEGVLTVSVPKSSSIKTHRVAVRTSDKSESDKIKA
jgi:HSP20 family protein